MRNGVLQCYLRQVAPQFDLQAAAGSCREQQAHEACNEGEQQRGQRPSVGGLVHSGCWREVCGGLPEPGSACARDRQRRGAPARPQHDIPEANVDAPRDATFDIDHDGTDAAESRQLSVRSRSCRTIRFGT